MKQTQLVQIARIESYERWRRIQSVREAACSGATDTTRSLGIAAVEFAVVLPLMIMLILGALEIGRA